MKTIGDRIKKIRESLGLTGEEFGKKLNVAKGSVSNWENSNRTPDVEMIAKIASLGNVTTDYILCRTDNKNSFITEHIIDGHVVKVTADKENFPEGFTEKDAGEYLQIATAMKTLGISKDELDLLLKLRQLKIGIEDLDLLSKLKELGIKFEK